MNKKILKLLFITLTLTANALPAARQSGYQTDLHFAAMNNNPDNIAQLLASRLVNVNAQDRQGWTALHIAAANGYGECVFVLVQMGANRFLTTNKGDTAADLAEKKGHKKMAQFLRS
ncbi:ankyrin repeat domain-containing protein [bacterium]|nr:MAG: ankyrin repeat domain-containing protein [bacterium]